MAVRDVVLTVEALLASGKVDISEVNPHSVLTRMAVMDVMGNQRRMAYMAASAAVRAGPRSHPRVDIKDVLDNAVDEQNGIFVTMLPYAAGGMTPAELAEAERQHAIDQYRAYEARVLGEPVVDTEDGKG